MHRYIIFILHFFPSVFFYEKKNQSILTFFIKEDFCNVVVISDEKNAGEQKKLMLYKIQKLLSVLH